MIWSLLIHLKFGAFDFFGVYSQKFHKKVKLDYLVEMFLDCWIIKTELPDLAI